MTNNFPTMCEAVNNLAVIMKPTRNGIVNAVSFMKDVENMFKLNEWSFTEYVSKSTENHLARLRKLKNQPEPKLEN